MISVWENLWSLFLGPETGHIVQISGRRVYWYLTVNRKKETLLFNHIYTLTKKDIWVFLLMSNSIMFWCFSESFIYKSCLIFVCHEREMSCTNVVMQLISDLSRKQPLKWLPSWLALEINAAQSSPIFLRQDQRELVRWKRFCSLKERILKPILGLKSSPWSWFTAVGRN